MRRATRRWLWLLVPSVLSACPSMHSGLTARPLGKGAAEVGLHGGMLIGDGGEVVPTGNVEIRVGVSERTDLLVETGMVGVGLGFKSTVTPPDAPVVVAVAPEVSGLPLLIVNGVHFGLPVLIGFPYRKHELTVSPRVDFWHYDALGGALAAIGGTSVGGTVDLSVRLGPIRLVPELAVIHVVGGNIALLDGDAEETPKGTVMQTNLFLLFERKSRAARGR